VLLLDFSGSSYPAIFKRGRQVAGTRRKDTGAVR
jgi:hypothetical protein